MNKDKSMHLEMVALARMLKTLCENMLCENCQLCQLTNDGCICFAKMPVNWYSVQPIDYFEVKR